MTAAHRSAHHPLVRQLAAVGPHAGAHRVAVRAAVSVLVPLLVLWLVHRQEWSIYAAFGAFTSLYGRHDALPVRFRMQVALAVLLTGSVTLGVVVGLSPHRAWLAVPVAAVVAAVASLASDALAWHPPGPLFVVFAFAACASVPGRPGDVGVAVAVAAAAASFSVLVGGAGPLLRRGHGGAPDDAPDDAPGGAPGRRARGLGPGADVHVLRGGLAVLGAGTVATAAGIGHPYWAMVSAVVPLVARDPRHQVVRGLQRLVGTYAGLLVAGLLLAAGPSGVVLVVLVACLQLVAELLVGRNYSLALVAITPLALLMVHLGVQVPASTLLVDRGVETLIGVVVGLGVGLLTRRRRPEGWLA